MADIQHVAITDPNIHEPKGVTSASANQVYVANGDGESGTWTDVDYPVSSTTVLEARSFNSQAPTGLDSPIQIEFGAEQINGTVDISSAGVITIQETGTYFVTTLLRINRSSGTGFAALGIRYLLNGTAVPRPTLLKITNSGYTIPFTFTTTRNFTAGDELTVEFVRDSAGSDNGSLEPFSFALAGWDDAASAAIMVTKLDAGL